MVPTGGVADVIGPEDVGAVQAPPLHLARPPGVVVRWRVRDNTMANVLTLWGGRLLVRRQRDLLGAAPVPTRSSSTLSSTLGA
jgi:hypothetical protein